jgi:hypothetical protein
MWTIGVSNRPTERPQHVSHRNAHHRRWSPRFVPNWVGSSVQPNPVIPPTAGSDRRLDRDRRRPAGSRGARRQRRPERVRAGIREISAGQRSQGSTGIPLADHQPSAHDRRPEGLARIRTDHRAPADRRPEGQAGVPIADDRPSPHDRRPQGLARIRTGERRSRSSDHGSRLIGSYRLRTTRWSSHGRDVALPRNCHSVGRAWSSTELRCSKGKAR